MKAVLLDKLAQQHSRITKMVKKKKKRIRFVLFTLYNSWYSSEISADAVIYRCCIQLFPKLHPTYSIRIDWNTGAKSCVYQCRRIPATRGISSPNFYLWWTAFELNPETFEWSHYNICTQCSTLKGCFAYIVCALDSRLRESRPIYFEWRYFSNENSHWDFQKQRPVLRVSCPAAILRNDTHESALGMAKDLGRPATVICWTLEV